MQPPQRQRVPRFSLHVGVTDQFRVPSQWAAAAANAASASRGEVTGSDLGRDIRGGRRPTQAQRQAAALRRERQQREEKERAIRALETDRRIARDLLRSQEGR